jgi:hypothetical protein
MLHVTPATRQQSARALLKMFYGKASSYSDKRCSLVFIQQSTGQDNVRYVEVSGDVPQHVWVRGAGSSAIAGPVGVAENGAAKVIERTQ